MRDLRSTFQEIRPAAPYPGIPCLLMEKRHSHHCPLQQPPGDYMPYLAFNLNNGDEFVFDLVEDRISLGRNSRNEVVIENTFISDFHAELLRQSDGGYEVMDLKSSAGTFVNDERIDRMRLRPGDNIRFGELQARYNVENRAEPQKTDGPFVAAANETRHHEKRDLGDDQAPVRKEPPAPAGLPRPSTSTGEAPSIATDPGQEIHLPGKSGTAEVPPPGAASPEASAALMPPSSAPAKAQQGEVTKFPQLPPASPSKVTLSEPAAPVSLIHHAPALAAAMEAGLSEQRAQIAKERGGAMAKSGEVEPRPISVLSAITGVTAEKKLPAAMVVPSSAGGTKSATLEVVPKVQPGGREPLERAKTDFESVTRDLEKSKKELESVQQQLAELKERKTRERFGQGSGSANKYHPNSGKDAKEADAAGVRGDTTRDGPHFGRLLALTFLTNAIILSAVYFWAQENLTQEVERRIAAYKPNPSAESTNWKQPQASHGEETPVEVQATAPDVETAVTVPVPLSYVPDEAGSSSTPRIGPATSAPSAGGEEISPTQRELVLLKERNRLTIYADEAIASGTRASYERLRDAFYHPALPNLLHAACAEILRVQYFYFSGSRIRGFDIPVGKYFPRDAGLTDRQLQDDQLIGLLREGTNPWQVRMKAATLLGTRPSMEAGDALVQAVKGDPNLDVVKAATFSFAQITGYQPMLFDTPSLEQCWKQYKETPPSRRPKTESPTFSGPVPDRGNASGTIISPKPALDLVR